MVVEIWSICDGGGSWSIDLSLPISPTFPKKKGIRNRVFASFSLIRKLSFRLFLVCMSGKVAKVRPADFARDLLTFGVLGLFGLNALCLD